MKAQEQIVKLKTLQESLDTLSDSYKELVNSLGNIVLKDVAEGKKQIAAAINTKGGQADPDSSFDQLAEDISTIPDINLTGWTFLDDYKPVNVAQFLNNFEKVVSIYDESFINIVKSSLFENFEHLTTIDLPALRSISGGYTFGNNPKLTTVHLPALTSISRYSTFESCSKLTTVHLPALTTINGDYTFSNCIKLTTIDLPALRSISGSYTFESANLTNLILGTLERVTGNLFVYIKTKLRNVSIGIGTDINLSLNSWTATNVIAEGQSGIDELNSNLYNNLLTKLYDHSEDGEERTLRLGWYNYVSEENKLYAKNKGWNITT
jgi:hypothetical protein